MSRRRIPFLIIGFILYLLASSCQSTAPAPPPEEKKIVEVPVEMNIQVSAHLQKSIEFARQNSGRIMDTVWLKMDSLVQLVYGQKEFKPIWSSHEHFLPLADSLFDFILHSREYGLFPSDYHFRPLLQVRSAIATDSISQKNAALWSRADLMYTDALVQISKHLKQGRLAFDSVTLRKDSVLRDSFYLTVFAQVLSSGQIVQTLHQLEPKHKGYDELKTGLKHFLDSVKAFRRYTFVQNPSRDTAGFYRSLQMRFFEEDILPSASQTMDTASWRQAISNYQKSKNLKVTGKPNLDLVKSLNNTDFEKFKRIAINLDRYKLLPDSLPSTYVWVNIPSYMLRLMDTDTLVLESRIIVGQPQTRTPLLTSSITNFITYPQWNVPTSIIFKEMLPKIQKNIGFLAKENLMVVDKYDSVIDPINVNWARLNKNNFPYRLKQREGDDNSLGVLKFNFPNKYSVYLHDTNARWLFSKSNRAMSHGCVRVKDWEKLANYLVRNQQEKYHPDTLKNWISRQEKHTVWGFQRMPLYIRYFSVEGKNGNVRFYEDIYGEDRILRDRFFADKSIL